MKYDPRFGYTYMPGMKSRVANAGGGYLVRTNTSGFRSDHEFLSAGKANTFRALLYGDSQSAGDGVSNKQRFSDILENELPGLEIYNYALSGTSVDQHYLLYDELGHVDHDLIIIAFYVENILRVRRRVVKARDANGNGVFRAKPYYEVNSGELTLHNVPVPKQPWTAETLPAHFRPHVYSFGEANVVFRNQSRWHAWILRLLAPFGPLRRGAKRLLASARGFHPLPGYDDPNGPDWLVLREILKMWVAQSSRPVVLMLIPLESAIAGLSDPSNYQARFRELSAETGCQVHDLLPGLLELPRKDRLRLWSYKSGHLSPFGHQIIARLMAPVVEVVMRPSRHINGEAAP